MQDVQEEGAERHRFDLTDRRFGVGDIANDIVGSREQGGMQVMAATLSLQLVDYPSGTCGVGNKSPFKYIQSFLNILLGRCDMTDTYALAASRRSLLSTITQAVDPAYCPPVLSALS